MGRTIRRTREFVQKIANRAGLTPAQTRLAADIVQGICQSESCHLIYYFRKSSRDAWIFRLQQPGAV